MLAPPISNVWVKMVSIYWVAIGFNCAAVILDHKQLAPFGDVSILFQCVCMKSTTEVRFPDSSHSNFDLYIFLINRVSTVLACATIIFDRTYLISQIWVSSSTTKVCLPSPPAIRNFSLHQLGFNWAQLFCNIVFNLLASLPLNIQNVMNTQMS